MTPDLIAQKISFHRHGEPVFEPIDLTLWPGSITVITGANGAGKTTLMRLIAGILPLSEGRLVNEKDLAFIGHRPPIKNDLDCIENLEFAQHFYSTHGRRPALRVTEALIRVGLAEQSRQTAGCLSAGQRRRLALARLLVAPAAIWLLDEPYTSLDDEGSQWLDALLSEHLASLGAALVSAHARIPKVDTPIHYIEVKGKVGGS